VVVHPLLGSLAIEQQDLLGPDANQNGVRDELDKTLRDKLPEGAARVRGEAYALEVTKAMLAGAAGRVMTVGEVQAYTKSRACLAAVNSDAPELVYSQTTRTRGRADAMRAWAESTKSMLPADSFTCPTEERV